jgi:hypothetical protein
VDDPPAHQCNALYVRILRIRKIVAGLEVPLVREAGGYRLDLRRDSVDTRRVREMARLARDDSAQPAAHLEEALSLWRGRPFAGLNNTWLQRLGDELQQEYLSILIGWSDLMGRQGSAALAMVRLTAAHGEQPTHGAGRSGAMRALHAAGGPKR